MAKVRKLTYWLNRSDTRIKRHEIQPPQYFALRKEREKRVDKFGYKTMCHASK